MTLNPEVLRSYSLCDQFVEAQQQATVGTGRRVLSCRVLHGSLHVDLPPIPRRGKCRLVLVGSHPGRGLDKPVVGRLFRVGSKERAAGKRPFGKRAVSRPPKEQLVLPRGPAE